MATPRQWIDQKIERFKEYIRNLARSVDGGDDSKRCVNCNRKIESELRDVEFCSADCYWKGLQAFKQFEGRRKGLGKNVQRALIV